MRQSRRNFIKGSTAALVGLTLVETPKVWAAGDDRIKAVLVGCGGRGCGAASDFLLQENTALVGIADLFPDRAENAANIFGVPKENVFSGFDAYRRVMEQTDCNYVLLATPPGFRPIHYQAAIEMNKHVFLEKPCCVDAPGFKMLIETTREADKKGLNVCVGLQRHHQLSYINGMKAIADGEFGDVVCSQVYWNRGRYCLREDDPNWTEMERQIRRWNHFVWLSGDNIAEQNVHNIDVCNWAMTAAAGDDCEENYWRPVEANGMGGQASCSGPEFGVSFDHFFVEFTYKNGRKLFSQSRQADNVWMNVDEIVHGTKKTGRPQGEGDDLNPWQTEHRDMVAAIRKGERMNEGWIGAYSSMTAVLGYMAAYSGQRVTWDDAVANGPALMIYEDHDKLTLDSPAPVFRFPDGSYPVPQPGVFGPFDDFRAR